MATSMTLPNYLTNVKLSCTKCLKSAGFQSTRCAFSRKFYYQYCFPHADEQDLIKNFGRTAWQIKSSVDGSAPDPSSSSSSTSGGTRLVREIQALRTRLIVRIQEIRKDLPTKLIFFLVGFYCATAFATVIGQTGDWDILSAGLAVVVVEGIGALMYSASFQLFKNIRSIISMFNYWKAGLTLDASIWFICILHLSILRRDCTYNLGLDCTSGIHSLSSIPSEKLYMFNSSLPPRHTHSPSFHEE